MLAKKRAESRSPRCRPRARPKSQPRADHRRAKKLTVDPTGVVAGQKRKVEIRAQVERGDGREQQQGMANFWT